MKLYRFGILGLILLFPMAALADFQYQETTQITGGSILGLMKMASHFSRQARQAGDPIVSTVYVQGNRMARVNAQTIEIVDLDKETITNIDMNKRTYTQMTFEQMRQMFEQMAQQMKDRQAQQTPASSQPQPPSNVDLQFKVNVRNTGANKQLSGLNASESILTLQLEGTDTTNGQKGAFAMTNDMWMTPDVPGYEELREFNRKFAAKMGGMVGGMSSAMASMQPGMAQGMSRMMTEVSKLKGIPVEQVMRMGATANGEPLPAASEAPLPPSSSGPQMPSAGEVAKQSASSAIASKLGGFGFGGFGHKKQQAPPPDDSDNPQQQPPTATVLMELHTEMTSFSSAPIGADKFAVPPGFQQVQPQQMK